MNLHDKKTLAAICEHISNIRGYCAECQNADDFMNNKMLVEACVFNLMQIGELSKTELSEECKRKLTAIPWQQLYGMRNRIVHGYSGVRLKIIWDTICDDLPALYDEIKAVLDSEE